MVKVQASGETLQRLRAERGLSLRQAAADIGIAVETLRRLEQGKPAHAATANSVARFYDVDPSELFVMEGPIDPQLVLLEAVLGTLDVDGLRSAANAIGMRGLAAGNGAERELFQSMAKELEREADRRSPSLGEGDVLDAAPEPRDTQWVESLPEWLRGVSFNMHGDAVVYTVDDHVLHSDMDWRPMRVRDGVAHGLILDRGEERFVAGMWALNEYARRKRSRPR
jgi:transcriptional regulator with XRE-family HTH domain